MSDAAVSDASADLPPGWAWAELGEILPLSYGKGLPKRHRNSGGAIPVFGSSGHVDNHDEPLTKGPTIIVGRKGNAGAVYFSEKPAWPIDTVYFTEPRAGLNGKFFTYLLDSLALASYDRSTAIPSLMREPYNQIRVGVPPVPEQRRIVEKIEALLSDIASGVEGLEAVELTLATYRQAVLKAAVTGELTRDWRESHPLRKCGADAVREASKALGQIGKKGHKAGRTGPVAASEKVISNLPETWTWCRLRDIAEVVGGITKDKKRDAQPHRRVPYLRVANVQRGHLDLTHVKDISASEDAIEKLKLLPNDVLFTEGGDRDKLGRGWIWEGQISECIHQNHIFRSRLYSDAISPKFISWFANVYGQHYFIGEGAQTTNLASISLSKLKAFPIPVPPEIEATEIESAVEARTTVIDQLRNAFSNHGNSAAQLKSAILSAAFAGRLVPQDPNDEPASELLARIRRERAAAPAARRRGRPRKAARRGATE